jgi:hypothetical protein
MFGRLARWAALIGIGCSLVVITGCANGATSRPAALATTTATYALAATKTATTLTTLYAVFADGTLHALNAADGAPRWSASVGGTYHRLVAGT